MLPAAKTPVPNGRRRRRVKTPAAATTATTSTGKENELSNHVTNRRRATKAAMPINDHFSFLDLNSQKTLDGSHSQTLQQLLHGSKDHATASSLWKDRPGLAECVVKASLCFNKNSSGLFLLEENTAKLLNTARKLIKEATEKHNKQKYGWLMIATHILRAVGPLLDQNKEKQETCFRLLYHLITLASDMLSKGGDWKAGLVVIAGYEVLGDVLIRYSTKVNEDIVSFDRVAGNKKSSYRFVHPIRDPKQKRIGTMDFHQIATIAFKTTLSVANCYTQLWFRSVRKELKTDDLFCVFGKEVQACISEHVVKTEKFPHHVTVELLETIYLPWLRFLADFSNIDNAKELSSNCKVAHRLLWDAASKLKGVGSTLDKTEADIMILELRRSAIIMMLPCTSEEKIQNFIQKDHFEFACSNAWKASNVFTQQSGLANYPTDPGNPLHVFHTSVGESLEILRPLSKIPLSYVEYCAYRALHTAWSPSLPQSANDDACTSLLSILSLGIRFRRKLEAGAGQYQSRATLDPQCTILAMIEFMQQRTQGFDKTVLQEFKHLSSDFQNRCSKLFSMISLHRCIFAALKENSWKGSQADILGAGLILVRCIGPFMFENLRSLHDESKIASLYDMVVECFVRPLSAFEALRNDAIQEGDSRSAKYLLGLTDEVAERLCIACSSKCENTSPPLSCIEKAAKSLSILSRQRSDNSMHTESVNAQLYSLKLYSDLTVAAQGTNYHLPSRFVQLASTLQHLGKYLEACLAFCLVLASEVNHCYQSENSNYAFDLLHFLAAKSKGILFPANGHLAPSNLARTTINRLVNLVYTWRRSYSETLHELLPSEPVNQEWMPALDILIESLVHGNTCTLLNRCRSIGQVLVSSLCDFRVSNGEASNRSCVPYKCLMLLVDIEVALGDSISQNEIDDKQTGPDRNSVLLEEYHLIASEIQRAADIVIVSEECDVPLPAVKGLLNLTASASLLPLCSFYQRKKLDESFTQSALGNIVQRLSLECHQSFMSADMEENSSDNNVFSLSVAFSWMYYHSIIEEKNLKEDGVDELFGYGERCFQALRGYSVGLDGATLFAAKSFIWSLTQLLNQLQREGAFSRVATLAKWIHLLLAKDSIDSNGGSSWSRSVMISAWISSDIRPESTCCGIPLPDIESAVSWSASEFAQAELFACGIRGFHFEGEVSSKSDYPDKNLDLLKLAICERCYDSNGKHEAAWLPLWVLSTIELAQSELAAACGYFHLALQHVQRCIRICQEQQKATTNFHREEDSPFWVNIASSGHQERVSRRIVESLSHRSYLCQQIGDHRKVSPYLMSACKFLGIQIEDENIRSLDVILSIFKATKPLVQRHFFRLFVSMHSATSAFDLVEHAFSRVEPLSEVSDVVSDTSTDNFERKFGLLRDMMSVGDVLYTDFLPSESNKLYLQYYREAMSIHQEISQVPNLHSRELLWVAPQVQLRHVRLLMDESISSDDSSLNEIAVLCSHITKDSLSRPEDKAWAHYYLGLLMLAEARSSGCLQILWDTRTGSPSRSGPSDSIHHARRHFLEAATCSSLDTGVLSRNILRSLALASGPDLENVSALSSSMLILASIGRSSREFVLRSLSDRNGDSGLEYSSDLFNAFSAFDGDLRDIENKDSQIRIFFDALSQSTPSSWKFVAVALCPSGELLLVSIEKCESTGRFQLTTECRFPTKDHTMAYDEIIKPLDTIIQRSQDQLNGMDQIAVSEKFSKDSEKRSWWERRGQLDIDLCRLLETVDSSYFGFKQMKECVDEGGQSFNESMFHDDEMEALPRGNLAARFEAAHDRSDDEETMGNADAESLKKLTVVKLKALLRDYGFSDKEMRKLRKQQLIDKLIEEENSKAEEKENSKHHVNQAGLCLFLILDENLSRFPFEGMPSLQNQTVSRILSLPFLFATLLENDFGHRGISQIEAPKVSYVLDPEGNLQATRSRLEPVIENVCAHRNCSWDSCIGELPTAGFVETCLRKENGLFLYFGHGGGQLFFSRRQVEELGKRDNQGLRLCRASVVLMGCSSGRLVSVNRKHSKSIEQLPLHYEPEGIALSYLCAGAPCVVGNLWDVTDRDIDRFSTVFVEEFFNSERNSSLPETVSLARYACKLRYIVGCAPVCYGIPVNFNPYDK